jgi:hypothetical protein
MFKNLLPVLLAMAALPAGATTTYTSQSSMTNDPLNSGLTFTNVDFSGLTTSFIGTTFATSGVTFTPVSSTLSGATLGWSTGTVLRSNGGGGMTIDLPSTATAFGGYFGYATGGTFSILLSSGGADSFSFQLNPTASNSPVYLGIVSDVAFSSISFTPDPVNKFVALNGLTYGTASVGGGGGAETPEPSTLAMVGVGLIAFPWIARRKRRAQSRIQPTAGR